MQSKVNELIAKVKTFRDWAKPLLKAGLRIITQWAHALWKWSKPLLTIGLLTVSKWSHALLVWICNWTRTNWQAGRKGRIKVAIAGAILMLLIGLIFFSSGESNNTTCTGDDSNDMYYSESEPESKTVSKLATISLHDYEPQGDDADTYVERWHDLKTATANYRHTLHFQLKALPNGGYNYLVYRHWEHVGWSARNGNGEISLAVFNDTDAFDAFLAYKQAVRKAREWIKIGRENHTTISGFKDMDIDSPNGCAVKIPNAGDKWIAFDTVASIPNHKKAQTRLEFSFSEDHRCLRLNCGDIYVDYDWQANNDERELAALESACDLVQLFRLFKGREGESSQLQMSQAYDEIPSFQTASEELPEWKCGDICTLRKFPGDLTVTLSKRGDNPYNYTFSPYRVNDRFGIVPCSHLLIFPRNSYNSAYSALERAFRIALAWRDTAKKKHMLNLVKAIDIPCPDSVAVEIIGVEDFKKRWWEALDNYYQPSSGKRTRFWFSVNTAAHSEGNGKYSYRPEDTTFNLYFGNKDAVKHLRIDDKTIAAFKLLNPQLALEMFEKKAESEKVFQ